MNRLSTKSNLYVDLLVRSASDILNAAIALTIVALIARHLSAADYGIYSQVITTASLLLPLLTLRLNTACVRFFPSIAIDPLVRKRHFTTAVFIVLTLSLFAIVLLVSLPAVSATMIFGQVVSAQLMLLLGVYLAVRCLVTLGIDYFRAMNRSNQSSAYNTIRFVLTLGLLLAAIARGTDVDGVLYAYIAAELLILVALGIHLQREDSLGSPSLWAPKELSPYLAYSLPLLPYSMFVTVNQFADRYFITHLLGLEETGVYAFSYNLIASAFLLNASIAYVIYPHLCRLWEDDQMEAVRERIEGGQRIFVFIAVPLALGLGGIYTAVVTAMVGESFIVSGLTFSAIIFGQFMLGLCSIFGFIIDLSKRTTFFVKVLFGTATLNICGNAILVPRYGIEGAAVATAITYLAQLGAMWIATRNIAPFRVSIDFRFLAACLMLGSLMLGAVFYLQPNAALADILLAIVVAAVVYALGALVIFRGRLSDIIGVLKPRVKLN